MVVLVDQRSCSKSRARTRGAKTNDDTQPHDKTPSHTHNHFPNRSAVAPPVLLRVCVRPTTRKKRAAGRGGTNATLACRRPASYLEESVSRYPEPQAQQLLFNVIAAPQHAERLRAARQPLRVGKAPAKTTTPRPPGRGVCNKAHTRARARARRHASKQASTSHARKRARAKSVRAQGVEMS